VDKIIIAVILTRWHGVFVVARLTHSRQPWRMDVSIIASIITLQTSMLGVTLASTFSSIQCNSSAHQSRIVTESSPYSSQHCH